MNGHNRFNEEHREACQMCYDAYGDFLDEQFADAQLDALAELATAGVIE